ncbi:MAG: hypothetical protein HXX08_11105 [Chloroflexi bacterium]|uniref:Uncharacterized protein n=1 Tax=Candidatus Chlorohelix allophototropha TaxID=3003348 RepID=A0A8T7M3C9_9CHLR|nr:hypothetical protein [Chloroflexota bacterium]WJW65784.1 hypothetical protein OZ401_001563 [Chloroflexota bacterium L227-S17]
MTTLFLRHINTGEVVAATCKKFGEAFLKATGILPVDQITEEALHSLELARLMSTVEAEALNKISHEFYPFMVGSDQCLDCWELTPANDQEVYGDITDPKATIEVKDLHTCRACGSKWVVIKQFSPVEEEK